MATFFEHFTPQEIARISATGRRVKLPEGWSPIWKDTPADKAYILLSGTVSVRRDGTEIAQLGPGEIVGEAAIVGGKLRNATIVALTPASSPSLCPSAALRRLIGGIGRRIWHAWPNWDASVSTRPPTSKSTS